MKRFIIIVLMTIMMLPTLVLADAAFVLHNTSEETRIVVLLWVDHPFDNAWEFPIMGAVLEPDEDWELGDKYPPGIYFAEWRLKTAADPDKYSPIVVENDTTAVLITPDDVIYETGLKI